MVFQRLKSKSRIRTRPIAFRGFPRLGGSQNLASRLEIPCGYLVDTSLSHSPLPLQGKTCAQTTRLLCRGSSLHCGDANPANVWVSLEDEGAANVRCQSLRTRSLLRLRSETH